MLMMMMIIILKSGEAHDDDNIIILKSGDAHDDDEYYRDLYQSTPPPNQIRLMDVCIYPQLIST